MIKAIVFDFDGTIIDTESVWYRTFQEAYASYGVDLPVEMYAPCIGTGHDAFNPFEYLVTDLHFPIDLVAFRRAVTKRHAELMEQERIRPGIMDYLQSARVKGLKIGLASSSSRAWVRHFTEKLGLRPYFDYVQTADDVDRVKPDPALYLQTLQGLGVSAEDAVAIEDSPNGARAAKAAGLYCILAPSFVTRDLEFGPVDRRLNSLTDLSFNALWAERGIS